MNDFNIKIVNLKEVQQYFMDLPEDTFAVAKKEMTRSLFEADKNIKKNTRIKNRTGNLLKSINTRVAGKRLDDLEGSIFTDSIYAPLQEEGGTVRPKDKYMRVPGGPYLNIPTSDNKTPAGVTRMQAREVFASGGQIRKFKSGKYGVILGNQLMFILSKSVYVPPRLGMVESTEAVIPTMLSRIAAGIGED